MNAYATLWALLSCCSGRSQFVALMQNLMVPIGPEKFKTAALLWLESEELRAVDIVDYSPDEG